LAPSIATCIWSESGMFYTLFSVSLYSIINLHLYVSLIGDDWTTNFYITFSYCLILYIGKVFKNLRSYFKSGKNVFHIFITKLVSFFYIKIIRFNHIMWAETKNSFALIGNNIFYKFCDSSSEHKCIYNKNHDKPNNNKIHIKGNSMVNISTTMQDGSKYVQRKTLNK